jgi:glycosyltransferase involved in cell wall biosynthesis
VRVLLVGPAGPGGEGTYMRLLRTHPPPGVDYTSTGGFHEGGPGVTCSVSWEIALNRIVHPRAIPDMGFRALRLTDRFDLVHVHAHPVLLRRTSDAPLVMSEGSSSAVYLGDYLGWDDKRIAGGYRRARRMYRALGVRDRLLTLEKVTRVYVFSEWARRLNVRWGADPEKLDVIPPGFPTPTVARSNGDGPFSFLFLGTDFERKGGFDVIEAFDRVRGENPAVRLVLAGSHPTERNPDRTWHSWVGQRRRDHVLARLGELEREGAAEVMGAMTADRAASLYAAADAFVMPSLAEGFGFANVEAMSHGLPVISSDLGPIAETISHGESGLLVPPGDVGELYDAMARLATEPKWALMLGQAAREAFLRRYTIERFTTQLGDFYRRAEAA